MFIQQMLPSPSSDQAFPGVEMQWYEGYLPSPQEAHSLAGNPDEEQALRTVGAYKAGAHSAAQRTHCS